MYDRFYLLIGMDFDITFKSERSLGMYLPLLINVDTGS